MTSTQNDDLLPALRLKQINVLLPEHQERLLNQYCVRHGVSANTVVIAALCAMIEGFELPENSVVTANVLNLK